MGKGAGRCKNRERQPCSSTKAGSWSLHSNKTLKIKQPSKKTGGMDDVGRIEFRDKRECLQEEGIEAVHQK
jgi:hypothetical protein